MRDGSVPMGENHMAVKKFSRSPAPRLTTSEGIRTENGLLPKDNYAGDVSTQVYSLSSNASCWRGLRDMALLGGPREIEGLANGQEIADLMEFHR